MWWGPDTADAEIYQTVLRLNENFLSELRSERAVVPVVQGVGSTKGREYGKRVPMLAIDQEYAPSGHLPSDPRLTKRKHIWDLLVPFSKVDDDLKRALAKWDVPDETEVFFTPPPRAVLAKSGSRIWADRRDATIGFALRIDNSRIAISTAGHLFLDIPFQ
jgi:hypothetical protein